MLFFGKIHCHCECGANIPFSIKIAPFYLVRVVGWLWMSIR